MSNSISSKLEASRKFLEKNARHYLNLKQVLSALADEAKANTELASLKASLGRSIEASRNSVMIHDEALSMGRLE